MIGLPSNTRIWLAAGMTDMRRGFDGLTSIVQEKLTADPFAGHVFVFRGRRGDLIKLLWWDAAQNFSFLRRLAMNVFRSDKSRSISLPRKIKTAAYNPDYFAAALQLREI